MLAGVCLLLSGCQQPKEKVYSKSQIVKKAAKSHKSGEVIQSLKLSTDTSSQQVIATSYYGGTPQIFHVSTRLVNNNQTKSTNAWISSTNTIYLQGSQKWYKANATTVTGHNYAELQGALTANSLLTAPSKKLIKSYHLKRDGNKYTLKATIKDPELLKAAASPIVTTISIGQKQAQSIKQMMKRAKYQNMKVKLVYQNNKLVTFNYFVYLKIGKTYSLRLGQSHGNFNTHNFLKLPTEASSADSLQTKK